MRSMAQTKEHASLHRHRAELHHPALAAAAGNRHAVFFTHAREAISYHYERNPADPRISHALTLEVDDFGNVLKSAAIGYGRSAGAEPAPNEDDKSEAGPDPHHLHRERASPTRSTIRPLPRRLTAAPLPCETRTYELTGFTAGGAARFASVSRTGCRQQVSGPPRIARDRLRAARRLHDRAEAPDRARPHALPQGRSDRACCRSACSNRWPCRARATSSPSPRACWTRSTCAAASRDCCRRIPLMSWKASGADRGGYVDWMATATGGSLRGDVLRR